MRRLLSLVLCIITVFSLALPASASLQYQYIDSLQCSLSIDNTWGIATCSGYVTSLDDVDLEIEVRLRVYKDGNWQTLKTWSNRDTDCATAGGDYAITHGYWYQTYATAYVYDDNGRIVESSTITQDRYY